MKQDIKGGAIYRHLYSFIFITKISKEKIVLLKFVIGNRPSGDGFRRLVDIALWLGNETDIY